MRRNLRSSIVASIPFPGPALSRGVLLVAVASMYTPITLAAEATVTGELRRWHGVTITFTGPDSAETAEPNPFLDYRLDVTFSRGDLSFVVPGFYAGDGQGGARGNRWRVRFAPPEAGTWSYVASFRAGVGVNVSLDRAAGASAAFDGASGSFDVSPSTRAAPDFRAPDRGLIRNRGHHYLTLGSGRPWIKGGPNIPENFLGYRGFDNSPKARHSYRAHEDDWRPGDPDWGDGRGRGIIGALNYIAGKGCNVVYFLPMNIGGDGRDTFPTIGEDEKTRYDRSKLEQWELVFGHAQSKGIFLHFLLAETEDANEKYHDGGELGTERRLYYRELIARFGHHNGLEFNLGEESAPPRARDEDWVVVLRLESGDGAGAPSFARERSRPRQRRSPPVDGVVTGFTLINAETDEPIAEFDPIPEGGTLNLARLPTRKLSIRANTSAPNIGRVRFGLDGNASFRSEGVPPYSLTGDSEGDYGPWTPSVGAHTVTATVQDTTVKLTFKVIDA